MLKNNNNPLNKPALCFPQLPVLLSSSASIQSFLTDPHLFETLNARIFALTYSHIETAEKLTLRLVEHATISANAFGNHNNYS